MKKNGYVLPLALIILALCTAVVTAVLNRSISYRNLAKIFEDREKSKMLAFAGIEIALNQITFKKEKEEDKDKKPANSTVLIINLLPIINTWQTFDFEAEQGIVGKLELYIACEQGKIDLNQLYDFAKKQYKQNPLDAKKMLQFLDEPLKRTSTKSFFEIFDKFTKTAKKPLIELSQLTETEGFKDFYRNLFISEPAKDQILIKFYDLFTLDSGSPSVNPWFISDSLLAVLGRKNRPSDAAKVDAAERLKSSKPTGDIAKDWNQFLSPIYGFDWTAVNNDIKKLFSFNAAPSVYSVFCIATVGSVSQKVFAILAQSNTSKGDQVNLRVKRIYWI